jgi:ABC-type phosphate transport system substrate-binding protein
MGRLGLRVAIRAAAILAASACCAAFAAEEIHGAGATFPAPLYAAWSAEYRRSSDVRVTFDAVGSGEGVERIRGRRVDFGASDAALTPQELTASGLLQFPVVIGGVVPVINIRGIKPGQLRLSGALLADIYLGKIKKWNDVSISALNPTAIGYVEFIYARNHRLSDVALRNRSGTFVQAGRDAFAAAADAANPSGSMQQQLATDAPGTASWPITGASFILIPHPSASSAKTLAVLRFFHWALHQGEPITRGLEYAPLPKKWVDQLPTLWMTIRDSTGQSLWP